MAARAVVVYASGLAMLRFGGPRILGRYAAADILTGVVLGSELSRPVNVSAPLFARRCTSRATTPTTPRIELVALVRNGRIRVIERRPKPAAPRSDEPA